MLTGARPEGHNTTDDRYRASHDGVNWLHLSLLVLMYAGVNNCYWLTQFGVTYLGGNKFVNGIILGIAEMTAGMFAGLLIELTTPHLAF